MKKTYTKPEISFESFLVSTNIAAGCEAQPNNQSNFDSCGIVFAPYVVFGSDLGGCTTPSGNLSPFPVAPQSGTLVGKDMVCYHVPVDTNNIFNS